MNPITKVENSSLDVCPNGHKESTEIFRTDGTDGLSRRCNNCGSVWHQCVKDATGKRLGYVTMCPDDCYWGKYKAEYQNKSTHRCVIL